MNLTEVLAPGALAERRPAFWWLEASHSAIQIWIECDLLEHKDWFFFLCVVFPRPNTIFCSLKMLKRPQWTKRGFGWKGRHLRKSLAWLHNYFSNFYLLRYTGHFSTCSLLNRFFQIFLSSSFVWKIYIFFLFHRAEEDLELAKFHFWVRNRT